MNEEPIVSWGESIASYRKARGLSRQQVADETGIGLTSLFAYEHDYSEPSLHVLVWLSQYYGVGIDQLVGNTVSGGRR